MDRADLEQWKAKEVARLLALVETERRYYQEIVASLPIGLLIVSSDLSILSANRAVRKIFGLRSGDRLRGKLDAVLPAWILDRVEEVLRSGVTQSGLLVEPEGPEKPRLRIGILVIHNWDEEGEAEALLSIEDLSGLEEQTTAPSAKEPERPGASGIIDEVPAVVWEWDVTSKSFVSVSPQAEQLLGFPAQHWTAEGSFWTDRVHPEDREWVAQSYQRAIEHGETTALEFRALTAGGRTVWLRESARMVAGSEGRGNSLIGVAMDVTERRLLQQQLLQAERFEAVSKVASRLAHDLNNMLMIVTGYGEELLNGLPQGSALRADVQEILTATERMSGLTSQLLSFARRQAAPPAPVDLPKLLGSIEPRLRSVLGKQIELELARTQEAMMVRADAGQLEQLIVALAARLCATVAGEGRIRIETSRVVIQEQLRRSTAPLQPGSLGVITISGSGNALENEALSSFFETVLFGKEAAEDAGAAVSRAYAAVRRWGGDIAVSNESEHPVARVFLPLTEEAVEEKPKAPVEVAPAEPVSHLETILVVEDEPGIRALVRKILRRQGYEVLEAANGEEALGICRERAGKIDLLITDVIMPHLGGRELVDRVRELHGDAKVLYVSGYTDDASIYSGKFPPGTTFLQKPFTLGALLDKVKEVLQSS